MGSMPRFGPSCRRALCPEPKPPPIGRAPPAIVTWRRRTARQRSRTAVRLRSSSQQAHLDGLTGAQRRELGRTTLQHEIERSRRSGQPFALAFVDVDGLKELNDREGHAAGDALLQTVVVALRSQMRSYDPIVRVGGDEFLCGFTNTDLETTRRRVEQIRAAIAPGPSAASISVGIAVLGERDTLEMLIARADADMYGCKELRRTGATSVVGRSPALR